MKRTRKAIGYVVRGNEILVFLHPHSPEAGLQVPAGTIKDGESPEEAVLREVEEETGESRFKVVKLLGQTEYDMQKVRSRGGSGEIHFSTDFHSAFTGQVDSPGRS